MHDEEDELSEPLDPLTRWSLTLVLVLGGFMGVFIMARRSFEHELAYKLLQINYVVVPVLAGTALLLGILALRRLRGKGFARRGLAIVGIVASSMALLAWLTFTIYVNAQP